MQIIIAGVETLWKLKENKFAKESSAAPPLLIFYYWIEAKDCDMI